MHLFYAPDILQTLCLSEEESLHCTKVLRLGLGTLIAVSDGKGTHFVMRIVEAHPKHTMVEIVEQHYETRDETTLIHIAIAPTKNKERLEWFAEKATELGVDIITPVVCHFSERRSVAFERLEKIVIAAMKQSQRAYLPKLNPAITFTELLKKSTEKQRFIAHCYEEERVLLQHIYTPDKDAIVLVGPEGDFSQEEITESFSYGFQPVSLGKNRLRTETAGIAACHIMQLKRL